ncbi:glycine receptor subunit alpha-2-like [Oppia nitens]|uniref:glycine receptor subunit alpha-2-like n=1 Tax=Oppia nitens TaxID=1686743 RepID=UPI0023DABA64|nr:glycine receptor subunit alpha-2-like [Oppia nitens]
MTLITVLLLIIVFYNNLYVISTENETPISWSLDKLIPKDYNKHIIPVINGSLQTISVSIEIFDLVSVVESGQYIVVDLMFHQKWKDSRLILPVYMQKTNQILLDYSWASKLWTPDTYFSNALESKIINVVNPIIYYTITNDNYIMQSIKMNVKFQCKMDLSQYPQDIQYCSIDIMSLTRNNRSVSLEWNFFKSLPLDDNPKFRLRETNIGQCEWSNHLGHFGCLTVKMKLVRRVSYYMIRIYGPTFLTTISSFVGFWIPVMAWPARVALLVTPLLTLVTQNVNVNSEINVSYVVALHWWMTVCIFFVFMSLIEFAVAISWVWMINDKKAQRTTQGFTEVPKTNTYSKDKRLLYHCRRFVSNILYYAFGNIDYMKDPLSRNKVDYVSRLLFPFAFILFVIIYILSTVCPWAVAYNW